MPFVVLCCVVFMCGVDEVVLCGVVWCSVALLFDLSYGAVWPCQVVVLLCCVV